MSEWRDTIKAYRASNRGGGLVLVTQHATEASRDVEIAAFLGRGDIGCIEVAAHVEPYNVTTIYPRGGVRARGPAC